MSSGDEYQNDDGLAVEVDRPKVKQPPMYKVVLLNDDLVFSMCFKKGYT